MPCRQLQTNRLVLLPLQLRYARELFPLWNDKRVVQYLLCSRKFTVYGCRRWIQRLLKSTKEANAFVILLNKQVIGVCGVPLLNETTGCYGLYYQIVQTYWGNGYAHEVSKELLKFLFSTSNAKYVETYAVSENKNSVHLLQKLGFVCKGIQKGSFIKYGKVLDKYRFLLTREQYAQGKLEEEIW